MTRPAGRRPLDLTRAADAPATRPALTVYLAAVLLLAGAARPLQLLRWDVAAVLLGLVVVLVILASMHQEVAKVHALAAEQRDEVTKVHALVNSQRDELVARIEQLTAALRAAGAQVPSDPGGGRR